MSKESSFILGSQFESVLIPKIYTYACVEESRIIKRLREELDDYKELLCNIMTVDDFDREYVCNECYHTKQYCFACFETIPCSYCFPMEIVTRCECCNACIEFVCKACVQRIYNEGNSVLSSVKHCKKKNNNKIKL
jgi:hypothetical protein